MEAKINTQFYKYKSIQNATTYYIFINIFLIKKIIIVCNYVSFFSL